MTIDKAKLKALAEAANAVTTDVNITMAVGADPEEVKAVQDYLQVAMPKTILALLAEIERLSPPDGQVSYQQQMEAWKSASSQDLRARAELMIQVEELEAENEALRSSSSCVDDLSALVRQLVHRLRKASTDNDLLEKALDYLRRKGLQGSPLRNERDEATEREARKIYDSWSGQDGFVPWVIGGNSDKQEEARRLASAAMAKESSHG